MTNRERILRTVVSIFREHKLSIEFGDETITKLHTHDIIIGSVDAGELDKNGEPYCWGLVCNVSLTFYNDEPKTLTFDLRDIDSDELLDDFVSVGELGFAQELDETLCLKGLPF